MNVVIELLLSSTLTWWIAKLAKMEIHPVEAFLLSCTTYMVHFYIKNVCNS
jgi:hypothetical protein